EAASIWGVEAHIEHQFTSLPRFWSGFGVYANFAYTDSDALQSYVWQEPTQFDEFGNVIAREQRVLLFPHERFNFQAASSGTVALTYNRSGIDATLAYGFQDRYQTSFSPNNLDQFAESVGTLDLQFAYFF